MIHGKRGFEGSAQRELRLLVNFFHVWIVLFSPGEEILHSIERQVSSLFPCLFEVSFNLSHVAIVKFLIHKDIV